MKNMLKLFVLGLLMAVGSNDSEAVSFRFKFKVFSSGPSFYACNAGIRHLPKNDKVCYFKGTTNACVPTSCSDREHCDTQCLCSGASGGSYLMDYMALSTSEWTDAGVPSTPVAVPAVKSLGQAGFIQQYDDTTAWKKSISQLRFDLGSELYGAEYFVDICYRGPQMEYFQDQVATSFLMGAQISVTDFLSNAANPGDNSRDGLTIPGTVDGKTYSELAGLQVQTFAVCDRQGEGNYQFASNLSGQYNTSDNEANFILGSNGLPSGGSDKFYSSSLQTPGTNTLDLLNTWINGNGNPASNTQLNAPRFCKIRYVFKEANTSYFRKWQRHGAEVCTYSSIEEGVN